MMTVQDSLDGKTWRDVGPAGTFKSKKALKEWYALFEDANNIDWRVGFLLRCRDGKYFRAVHKNDTPVKY